MGSALLLVLAASGWSAPAASPDTDVDFFEKKVRPVLVEHCYRCHSASAKSLKGGLRLDSRAATRKGGATGPAVVPGKPEESLLLKAIRYEDEALQMPPKKKLSAAVIADLEAWVHRGAADPRDSAPPRDDLQAARKHWAFQPIRQLGPPEVAHPEWATSPIDFFILEELQARGLSPSPWADRRTLLRRAHYDLIGLPPTAEETAAFDRDDSPAAFAHVVDRLLASPHYGERWGRHWLDVARYADTKDGVLMFGDDRVRPFAYTYRDYVIRAFNEDVPFDRFVHEQLAADLIEPKGQPWRLAAMGFLTLGRMFDNNIHDVLDDRIDTVTRGLLGMTVGCARCHDHKYDPIPTADYYSLYGIFASSEAPLELPLLGRPEDFSGQEAFEKKAGPRRKELQQFIDNQYAMLVETARQRTGDYLVHVATAPPDPLETAIFFLSLAPGDLRPQITNRWRRLLAERTRPEDAVFGPWHNLMQLPEGALAVRAPEVLRTWQGRPPGTERGQVNPLVSGALQRAHLTSRASVARAYGDLLRDVYEETKKSPPPPATAPATLQDRARAQLLDLVAHPSSPAYFTKGQTYYYLSRSEKDNFNTKRMELDRLTVQSPEAPPRAMVLYDTDPLYDPHVFQRGNPSQLGAAVPRRFLRVLAGDGRQPFPHGSGRLDLARAITAADNPLTSRVIVNRLWMHHFGQPLVDTPSDFGRRSNPPSHPELLDYLATMLQREGWSLKKLHRQLLLSSAYQQASLDRPDCRQIDPDNRLLWRMNRRRLDLEAMRDTLLAVSGRLDRRMGGRPVNVAGDPGCARRTVYALIDRQDLPGLFRAFDFASPDLSTERRPQTTVPQQALFGLNSAFVLEQARALAALPEVRTAPTDETKVDALYRRILGRRPDADEHRTAMAFIVAALESQKGEEKSQVGVWEQYAQVLLLTNEAMFVD